MALPGAGIRPLQTLPGRTWSIGASSSLSMSVSSKTACAHVHSASEVTQLEERVWWRSGPGKQENLKRAAAAQA